MNAQEIKFPKKITCKVISGIFQISNQFFIFLFRPRVETRKFHKNETLLEPLKLLTVPYSAKLDYLHTYVVSYPHCVFKPLCFPIFRLIKFQIPHASLISRSKKWSSTLFYYNMCDVADKYTEIFLRFFGPSDNEQATVHYVYLDQNTPFPKFILLLAEYTNMKRIYTLIFVLQRNSSLETNVFP